MATAQLTHTGSILRTNAAQTAPPSTATIEDLMEAVESCTERIRKEPYNPHLWAKRASFFLALNYPELAVGDACKSRILFHRSLDRKEGKDWSAMLRMYDVLGQALYDCHCHWEAAGLWEKVAKEIPASYASEKAVALRMLLQSKQESASMMGGTWWEQIPRVRDGCTTTVHYP